MQLLAFGIRDVITTVVYLPPVKSKVKVKNMKTHKLTESLTIISLVLLANGMVLASLQNNDVEI